MVRVSADTIRAFERIRQRALTDAPGGGLSTPPLRLGFIGGGINSAVGRAHVVASRMDGDWTLVAGAFSRHPDVNQATADAWRVDQERTYDDWRDLITREREHLDAVVVLTPTPSHADQIAELLDAGVDVISEKALTVSSSQAGQLDVAAAERGRFLAVTYNYSAYPMVRDLRSRIRCGELGVITALHIEMPQEGFLRLLPDGTSVMPQPWRQVDSTVPTVALDLGSHTHHLTDFLLGTKPVELVSTKAHHGRVTEVADYVNCMAKYEGGVDVSMWFGKTALGNRNGLKVRVFGTEGAAEWVQVRPEELHLSDAYGSVRVVDRASPDARDSASKRYERFKAGHPTGFIEAFANLYQDLATALRAHRSGTPYDDAFVYGAAHAADGLTMIEAMQRSHESRAWVEL